MYVSVTQVTIKDLVAKVIQDSQVLQAYLEYL